MQIIQQTLFRKQSASRMGLKKRSLFFFLCCSLFLSIQGCDSGLRGADGGVAAVDDYGVSATWNEAEQSMAVSGTSTQGDTVVAIHDADTNTLLGQAAVNGDGTWAATATTNACAVHVSLRSGTVTAKVAGAPADCADDDATSGGLSARSVIDSETLGTANPELLANVPNSLIVSPRTNVTISVGQSVTFAGTVSGAGLTAPVLYSWNFDGAVANSTVQNPGAMRFNAPGVYFVRLTTTDGLGVSDPTPAVRTITVSGNTPNLAPPVSLIISPQAVNGGVITIGLGGSLFFQGKATDPGGGTVFNYQWDFGGAFPNSAVPTPGNVVFSRVGRYVVTLNVVSALGVRNAAPATVTVVVRQTANANQAPDSVVNSPLTDITVYPGDTVNFTGFGRDTDNNVPFTYSWNFGGAAPNTVRSINSVGGNVQFKNPGVYTVSFTVTDALGLDDPTPAIRTVTVANLGAAPPSFDNIFLPPTNMTIAPGSAVFFAASSIGAAQYYWNFSGAVPASNKQTPGSITFSTPGVFLVELFPVDINGIVIGVPSQRVINVGGTTPQPISVSIVSPVANSRVTLGSTINLVAQVPTTGFGILTYAWTVRSESTTGGPAFVSNRLVPGPFSPASSGLYRVWLTVSGIDTLGNPISTTVMNTVTVVDPIINSDPISSPAQNSVVFVGQPVPFGATTVNLTNITYFWDFGGLANSSNVKTPGMVSFPLPGTYIVSLVVIGLDASGVERVMTSRRTITVLAIVRDPPLPPLPPPTRPSSQLPDGSIVTPTSNVKIRVGTPVNFLGRGFDPIGGALAFLWSFGGATPNVTSQNPGNVTFDRVGIYAVTLTVLTAGGLYDPTPSVVVVEVTP